MSKILVAKNDANLVSFAFMADKEIPRSIRFPESLWNAIDADARRCKRSSVKQMESVLSAYYELENTDLDSRKLKEMHGVQIKERGNAKIIGTPVYPELEEAKPKKKKTG